MSRPADASLGGSGRQRGGVAGLYADSEIVPCARLSRQRCAQARSACPSPRRPKTSAAPKKLCREVPEDRRARSTRGREGSFVKGPLREAVFRERCGLTRGDRSHRTPARAGGCWAVRGEQRRDTRSCCTWAARVAGRAGFRESLCSSPLLWCRDLQVFCAVCLDPLSSTFCLAITSLFSWRTGRVPLCHGDLCKPLGTRPQLPSFSSWPLLGSLEEGVLSPSHVPPAKVETASSGPSYIPNPRQVD